MVTRVGFGAALVLTLTLLLSACSPPGPVNPVSVTDPYSLGGTTIDLTTSGVSTRFTGTKNPASTFPDLPAGVLPPVAVSSYTVTLSVVGATVTGPNPPPATLSLTSPGGTVTLSDGSISGVAIDFFSTGTWTLQQTAANPPDYTYTVSGTASLVTMVTDASLLAQVMSVTTQGGDNQAEVQFGVSATGLPTADTLTLQFGPGSAVYNF